MNDLMLFALAAILCSTAFASSAPDLMTQAIETPQAKKWLSPQAPLRIHGDTYFVGFGGMSVVLIRTDAGLILIDGALPQAVSSIEANLKQLGFRIEDVKLILNTEAHFDHSGGIAALARDSGATTLASPLGARALRAGQVLASDPQAGEIAGFFPVANVREMGDGESLQLGKTKITAHFTPGHTPGSTSWSWKSCDQDRCLNMVFGSSLTAISTDDFHFADSKHGDLIAAFRKTLGTVAALPCDILISAHPEHSDGDEKLKRLQAQATPNPFIDPLACRTYADKYEKYLNTRLAKEKAEGALGRPHRR